MSRGLIFAAICILENQLARMPGGDDSLNWKNSPYQEENTLKAEDDALRILVVLH